MCRFEEHWLRLGCLAFASFRNLEIIFPVRAPGALPLPGSQCTGEGGHIQPPEACFLLREDELETEGLRTAGFALTLAHDNTVFIRSKTIIPFGGGFIFTSQIIPFLLLTLVFFSVQDRCASTGYLFLFA